MGYEFSHTEQGSTPLATIDVYVKSFDLPTTGMTYGYKDLPEKLYITKILGDVE